MRNDGMNEERGKECSDVSEMIIYRATPFVSQRARALEECPCPKSKEECPKCTCSLGHERSGPVYYHLGDIRTLFSLHFIFFISTASLPRLALYIRYLVEIK